MNLIESNLEMGVRGVYKIILARIGIHVPHGMSSEDSLRLIIDLDKKIGIPVADLIMDWQNEAMKCERLREDGRIMVQNVAQRALGYFEIERTGEVNKP